jgi:hypothetical protein
MVIKAMTVEDVRVQCGIRRAATHKLAGVCAVLHLLAHKQAHIPQASAHPCNANTLVHIATCMEQSSSTHLLAVGFPRCLSRYPCLLFLASSSFRGLDLETNALFLLQRGRRTCNSGQRVRL